VTPAEAARVVRALAKERIEAAHEAAQRVAECDGTRCWVSPGWRNGLAVERGRDWPDGGRGPAADSGVAAVLVAAPARRGKVAVCGYLVDSWCLGVKDALGPRRMRPMELDRFRGSYFAQWRSPGVPVPVELVRDLVLGAVDYARSLGFEPHREFARARRVLGPWDGASAITFGKHGKPYYVEGPYDDASRVLATLDRSVGPGGHDFVVSVEALGGLGALASIDEAA
jgi:hypothetical protein